MSRYLVAVIVLFCCAGANLAAALEIPFSVREPKGIERKAEPVSGGIPLPDSLFKQGATFKLLSGGKEIPVQICPLVVNTRGYLRWMLLDFQTDLAAGETKKFVLVSGAPTVKPPAALVLKDEKDSLTVNTGRISLVISRSKPFGLFSSVSAGGKQLIKGATASYTDGFSGKRYDAGKPDSVTVEYRGPMRTTICVKGHFVGDEKSRLLYIARVTAWAGRSDVHLRYTIANSNAEHYSYRALKNSRVSLQLASKPTETLLGASTPLKAGAEAWIAQALRPRTSDSARAGEGDKQLWTSKGGKDRARGWLAARIGEQTLFVSDLYFADDPARRLAVKQGVLALEGVFERWQGQGGDKGRPYFDKRRTLYDCSHLTSQYRIDFRAPADAARLATKALRVMDRAWAFAAPAWYLHQTDALACGKFATQADELACYDKWGWKYNKKDIPNGSRRRSKYRYGRVTQGNASVHFDYEEDILDQLLIMYMRTGAPIYWRDARAWANHWTDLYVWRTDAWRWKDGGVWKRSGPKGNRPQRKADPVTGSRNHTPRKVSDPSWTKGLANDFYNAGRKKCCKCHNWGNGMLVWYCLTGERDTLEAALDLVDTEYDTQKRAFGKTPGVVNGFSRDFNRAAYNTHAARMIAPGDAFVKQASEYFAAAYLKRPVREPRGLVNAAPLVKKRGKVNQGAILKGFRKYVGERGLKAMKDAGVSIDPETGALHDPATGAKWHPLNGPHTWMFPPLSRAMECYYRSTGNEDAMDWVIAYGQAAARVLYQRHGNLSYGAFLADFPKRGICKDRASWAAPEDKLYAEGVNINPYLARYHPDVPGRAYSLSGEAFLLQRAKDYWAEATHRRGGKRMPMNTVGLWVDYISEHDGALDFTLRTFYEHAHPRKDKTAPAAVRDLAVKLAGAKATVSFTAPADAGGKLLRYQVKCSDKPIIDYETFLKAYAANTDAKVTNWWMAANLAGEPGPGAPGKGESFTLTGIPPGTKYFAVRTFDDSSNRSALSNVAAVGGK
jgi:PcRGLX-like protein central beta sandwich domain